MNYKVVPIQSEVARSVRENMKSPQYGHPAFADVAKGYGPCRVCLKTFVKNADERILFTYNAFENLSDLPLPSPVYIHKNDCAEFEESGFPTGLLDLPLLLEAYGADSRLIQRAPFDKNEVENQIKTLFDFSEAKYINIRNAEAGCFVARIERI